MNFRQSPEICIIGAGIGGLTLQIALRARGIDSVIFEQASELTEIGAAVALSANATRLLIGFGLGLSWPLFRPSPVSSYSGGGMMHAAYGRIPSETAEYTAESLVPHTTDCTERNCRRSCSKRVIRGLSVSVTV